MQNGIACTVQAPDHFPSTFVSGEFRRNIYLTVKEALHNIVKHAQASSVIIKMQVDRQLQVEIRDNGTGFDPGRVRSFSNGLSNMEARIKNINGKFGIEIGSGTTVKIQVPLAV
jgi:signal transduction histidine kinase